MQDSQADVRKSAAEAVGVTLKDNLRTFALITNTLAKDKEIHDRWHGFQDIADSRHLSNRVEREVVDALVDAVHTAYPRLSHRYYKLKSKWFGQDSLDYWDRNAPLPDVATKSYRWDEARDLVLSAYDALHRKWPILPGVFLTNAGSTHRPVPASHPVPLLIRQCRQRTPTCF